MLLPYAHQPLTNHVVKCKVPLHWCQDIGYGVLKQRAGQDNDDGEESYYNTSQNQDLCKGKTLKMQLFTAPGSLLWNFMPMLFPAMTKSD